MDMELEAAYAAYQQTCELRQHSLLRMSEAKEACREEVERLTARLPKWDEESGEAEPIARIRLRGQIRWVEEWYHIWEEELGKVERHLAYTRDVMDGIAYREARSNAISNRM